MRIAMVLEATTGGTARHVVDLSSELMKLGHTLTLIYSPIRADSKFESEVQALAFEHLVRLPMHRAVGPWDFRTAFALRQIIGQLGPFDVLHGHSSKAGALTRLVTPKYTACVYTPHAFRTMDPELRLPLRLIYGGVERVLASFTDRVLVGSEQERQEARRLGFRTNVVRKIPFGLTEEKPLSRQEARRLIGLEDHDVVVGFVGRLTHQKAPERIVDAIAASRHKSLKLVIAGDGDQGDQLQEQIDRLGVRSRVIMLGWINGREIMPAFDLLAVPSRYESLGYVYMEAILAGVPVLTASTGLAPEIYDDNRLGQIVGHAHNSSAWSSALDGFIDRILAGYSIPSEDRKCFSLSDMAHGVIKAYEGTMEKSNFIPKSSK